jgi:hypothetical protein
MELDTVLLARLLAEAALIASTIEYCEIVRRRKAVRLDAALRKECDEWGLRALVRVFEVGSDEPRVAKRVEDVPLRIALARSERPPNLPRRLTRPIPAQPWHGAGRA